MNKEFFRLLEDIDINKLDMVYSSPNGITVLKSSEYNFRLNQINKLEKENRKLNNILNIIEQHCLNEQMPEEYLEYSAFVEVQNMVYDGIYEKIQELRGGNDE